MKKTLMFMALALNAISCSVDPVITAEIADPWNGYHKYLKMGEQVHALWAGKNINIGSVTYGIDESANFYVTYDCSPSGWLISESHVFAGDKSAMPLNKPGSPRIGLFPYSGVHDPRMSTITYTMPLASLPPAEAPGFVVAAHCVAHGPAGQCETAWGEGDYTFNDKAWGWYDAFYYTPPAGQVPVLFGTAYTLDSLLLYRIDANTGAAEIVLAEYVGNNYGTYDGVAFDPVSGQLFFTNYNTGELWVNDLQDEGPSVLAGQLDGIAASGAFFNSGFYYVDEQTKTINRVTFNDTWQIASETIQDTIPGNIHVNDIAICETGGFIYIAGSIGNGSSQVLTWEMATGIFYSMSIALPEGSQITNGSDGELYAVAPIVPGIGMSTIYHIITEDEIMEEIGLDIIIILDEPFSDLTMGL